MADPIIENLSNSQLVEYSFSRTPFYDSGLCQMPSADATSDAAFVRLHAPIKGEVISWIAKSEGSPPKVPSPFGTDCDFGLNDNMVLLNSTVSATLPEPMAMPKITTATGRAHVFYLSGTYTYAYKKAGTPTSKIPLGKLPYEKFNPEDNTFPADNFVTGVLDDTMVDTPTELESPLQDGP